MIECTTIEQMRSARWGSSEGTWGLVPTMGYLHEGHLSLVRRARAETDFVAVSIYVNPTQFAPDEDLETYPRGLGRDLTLLREEDVDVVFVPDDETMYPPGFQTTVNVQRITKYLEGKSRPTHFQGVTTVVAKLFNLVQPHKAYFGQKDAQQVVVIRQMVDDLNMNVEIVVCPIAREPDGLAMSSRNARLTADQRQAAPVLFQALSTAKAALANGEDRGAALRELMRAAIAAETAARLDYVSVARPETLEELHIVKDRALLSLAVFFGDVRLIDNMIAGI